MKRILSAAILPEVDFSLGYPSKDVLKQLITFLALDLKEFKIFQEGGKLPTPHVLDKLTQITTDVVVVL